MTIVPDTKDVMLTPGGFCFAGEGTRIHTLLGSCVSITLWHPWLRVGGMCHYMLPSRRTATRPDGRELDGRELDGRYADDAVRMFLREIVRNGTQPDQYEVKMFGGGNQFPDARGNTLDVPRDNIVAGLWLLEHQGFKLGTRQLGGTGARRLLFDLSTGDVWLNHRGRADTDERPRNRGTRVPGQATGARSGALSGSPA